MITIVQKLRIIIIIILPLNFSAVSNLSGRRRAEVAPQVAKVLRKSYSTDTIYPPSVIPNKDPSPFWDLPLKPSLVRVPELPRGMDMNQTLMSR